MALSDGRRRPARIVGFDQLTDIAVLKIEADGLLPAEWGDSELTDVGALVWAVGSPFGLERSITSGILSAKHRAGQAGTPFQDLMQTDAAVNPGNSGAPLVDATGRVVGINTAIVGPSYQGVSFAIPSKVAQRVYRDLKTRGAVVRGWLGIEPAVVSDDLARDLGLEQARGALVGKLADERVGMVSPARLAGIQPGDIIENPEFISATLSQLKALGVLIYIDDFGTGYSSLSYLHRFPIDGLKIDRSFIRRMGDKGENQEIIKTILLLAKDLNVTAIAEGIETANQLAQISH